MLVPTIGIEVHVELKTKTKVYSDSLNNFSNEPNAYVNVIDMGYPGTLPKLNKEVINMALKAAFALNCKVNRVMHFDRKNYFYPDLPKGYQITQKDTPIGYDGYVEIETEGNTKKIGIERMHIEEDTCKSIHGIEGTLLNFNRAGVPLIEIVTKPVIANEKEAVAYIEALREILLYLGISDVKIEEGSMRCDANVSLREEKSDVLGTKTEIKNIGSISNVAASIRYEIKRQKEILEAGAKVVEETRRFDEKTATTISMRVKETGNDYRYFPEPDLPVVEIDDVWYQKSLDSLPNLPMNIRKKYRQLGINSNNIKTIIDNYDLCMYLENIIDKTDPVIAANILTSDILSYLNKNNPSINNSKLTSDKFISIVEVLKNNTISYKQVKDVIPVVMAEDISVTDTISKMGLSQISDNNAILNIIKQVLEQNPESIEDYKEGHDRAIKYLMGQIMRLSGGKVNPGMANQMLTEELSKH
jgi:aspartyl-tRNA(Asn)/glutamyl-tRNA(Gln) amidotransferase subunit B